MDRLCTNLSPLTGLDRTQTLVGAISIRSAKDRKSDVLGRGQIVVAASRFGRPLRGSRKRSGQTLIGRARDRTTLMLLGTSLTALYAEDRRTLR